MKLKLETKVKRQGVILGKLSKERELRLGARRVSLYESGKCVGWVQTREFKSLQRKKAFSLKRASTPVVQKPDVFLVDMRPILLEKAVTVKLKEESMKKIVTIVTYTNEQRQYVYNLFKQDLIPLEINSVEEKYVNTDLREAFTRVNIRATRIERPSP